jgi:hypothetical protein
VRVILNLADGLKNDILALRAARWLMDHPDRSDAILQYGDSNDPPTMYAKRNKASISVWEGRARDA